VHDDDQWERRRHCSFDDQRDILDDHRTGGRLRDQFGGPLSDQRVQDVIEPLPGCRVAEHDLTEPGTIETTVGIEHARPELLHQPGQPDAAGDDHLPGDLVGVHQRGPQLDETRGDR